MENITLRAPAKINLFLDVSAKRPDGYHDIETVMQTVTLFDYITISRGDMTGRHIKLTCTDHKLPCDESNLCFRAAEKFFNAAGIQNYDVCIHVEKHIPISAGLGGGSADAAAVLSGLNRLYGVGFDKDKLCEIGAALGADVPFCIRGGILGARGIGDVFYECTRIPDCVILIACHGDGVSTPWAYKRLDELYNFGQRTSKVHRFVKALDTGSLDNITSEMANIFESAVLPEREYPRIIISTLLEQGALRAMMSGSGPSVMGIFKSGEAAIKAKEKLDECGISSHICKPFYPDEE